MKVVKSQDLSFGNNGHVIDEVFCSSREPVLVIAFSLPDDIKMLKENLFKLRMLTSNLCIDITPELIPEWQSANLFLENVHIFVRLFIDRGKKNYEGSRKDYIGNSALVQKFDSIKSQLPNHKVSVTIDIDKSDLTQLGATIYRLHMVGVETFFLDSERSPYKPKVKQIADAFEYLTITGASKIQVYFPYVENPKAWNLLTRNTYSGLEEIHIDVSNKCTHSCHFCGLYSEDNIRELKAATGKIDNAINKFMKLEIDRGKAIDMINSLPWTVRGVQFGGVGDPLMHPDAVDLFSAARERGFMVQVLSNMDYLDDEKIQLIHKLGARGHSPRAFQFIVNCSGANAETYVKTRPRQKRETFQKVVTNLKKFSDLKEKNFGRGVCFTIMCVITSLNYLEVEQMVEFSQDVGAMNLWLKPMEIHLDWMHRYTLTEEQQEDFRKILQRVLSLADKKGVELVEREILETTIRGGGF